MLSEKIKNFFISKYFKNILIIILILLFILLHWLVLVKAFTSNKQKTFTVIVDADSFPFNFVVTQKSDFSIVSEEGILIGGPEIKLMQEIAKKLDKKLKVKISGMVGLLESVLQGDADCALSAMSMTPKRRIREGIIFSNPYYFPSVGVLIRDSLNLNSNSDFHKRLNDTNNNAQKLKLIACNGHFHDENIQNIAAQKNVNHLEAASSMAVAVEKVNSKEADGFMIDYDCAYYVAQKADGLKALELKPSNSQHLFSYPYGIAFANTSEGNSLREKVNIQLKDILLESQNSNLKFEDLFKNNNLQYDQYDQYEKFQKEINPKLKKDFIEPFFLNFEKVQAKSTSQDDIKYLLKSKFKIFANYWKGYLTALMLAIDALIIGFFLSLIIVKIQISADNASKENRFSFYSKKIISKIINFFIFVFKGIPTGALALFVYFGFRRLSLTWWTWKIQPLQAGLIVISLGTSVNVTAMILNHIKFISKGEIEAAKALGMTEKQVFKYIVFQQALKRSYSDILNQLITNLKECGFLELIGVAELMFIAKRQMTSTLEITTPFIALSFYYLISIGLVNLFKHYLKKYVYKI